MLAIHCSVCLAPFQYECEAAIHPKENYSCLPVVHNSYSKFRDFIPSSPEDRDVICVWSLHSIEGNFLGVARELGYTFKSGLVIS